ncbi:MAG: MurR/RpiR family transcriptional regulator [Actinobacteria bacterium]|nr:MurR/RpiR family transcriptional regulator [Actinomycetota bacterium]
MARLRGMRESLPPAERLVAQRVLASPAGAAALTIGALAAAAGTSVATVQRLCRSIGLTGYPALRLALAEASGRDRTEDGRHIGSDIAPDEKVSAIVEKIAWADGRAIEDTAAQLDLDQLQRVVDRLVAAPRIDLYGVGASAFIALDFQQKLHRIGRTAFAWADPHIALTSAALLGPGDVAIGISHTGSTRDTVEAVAEARRHGATTVALTNSPRSPVTEQADHVLLTASRETTFRSGAMASRIAQLLVVDVLFVAVAARSYTSTQRALERTFDAVKGRRIGTENHR